MVSGPTIPDELLGAFERGELIVFVGPEFGRGTGQPDRAQLACELLADAESSDRGVDAVTLQRWIDEGRVSECLEVLERRLGARFQRVTERVLADGHRPLPPLARALASLSGQLRAVYTTEIDRLLERAFADEWPSFTTPRPDVVRRTKLIFKLCGTLEFRDTWVLTRAALEREFGERSLRRQLLTAAYRAHCLLFVGFLPGGELTERLLSILDLGSGDVQLPSHFAVFEHCDLEQRALFERRGLHVLTDDPVGVLRALGRDVAPIDASPRDELPTCPYPGLQSFDDSLAAVFHGRRAEVSQAASRLGGPQQRHRRWLAIDGSSGVGKSSFVHAGLVPALRRGFAERTPARWTVATLRPGRQPLHALARALSATLTFEHDSSAAWRDLQPATLIGTITEMAATRVPPGTALLVVVDQLEEIVTLAEPEQREGFANVLGLLLEQQLVYLVTTIRSDFGAGLASASPTLARLLNERAERYTLAPISRVGLRLAIAEPAGQLGVTFEAELVERIASDAEHHLGVRRDDEDGVVRTDDAALPLVAHVLRALWDTRAAEDGLISFAEYESLGGVSGALSRNADTLLAQVDRKQLARVKTLLLRMARLDGGRLARRTLTRSEALEIAGGGSEGERLLTLLSGGGGPRLLVVRGDGPDAVVDLVHEALLREWDTLRGWIAANRAQLARDEALARRAAAWVRQGRPWRSLPRGRERRELLRGRPHGRELAIQREYQRAMRRSGWVRGGGWVGFGAVVGVLVLLFVVYDQHRRDEQREISAQKAQIEHDLEAERWQNKQKDDRREVSRLLDEQRCYDALRRTLELEDDDSGKRRELLEKAVGCEIIVGEVERIADPPAVTALAVDSATRAWVGRSDGSVARWHLDDHTLEIVTQLDHQVHEVHVGPDGLVAVGSSGQIYILDADGEFVGKPLDGVHPVFSPKGGALAYRGERHLFLVDMASGENHELSQNCPAAPAFSLDGNSLVYANSRVGRSEIVTVAVPSSELLDSFSVRTFVRDMALAPDGKRLATTGDDNHTRLWSLEKHEESAEPLKLEVSARKLKHVNYSASGTRLVTLAANESLLVTDGNLNAICGRISHKPRSTRPLFSPDGQWLLTAGRRDVVSVRSAETAESLARVELEGELKSLEFSPVGSEFVSVSEEGLAIRWRIDGQSHWSIKLGRGGVSALAFDRNDPWKLTIASTRGGVATWGIGSGDGPQIRFAQDRVVALASSLEGWQAAVLEQGTLRRWSGSDPTDTPLCKPVRAATSPAGDLVAVECQTEGEVQLWTGSQRLETADIGPDSNAIAVSDERVLAVGRYNGDLEVWYLDSDHVRRNHLGRHPSVTSLVFMPDGAHLVSGGNDEVVRLWTLDGRGAVAEMEMGGENVEALATSANPPRIAAGDDNKGAITVWSLDGEPLHHFDDACEGHAVTSLRLSRDGEMLAAGCGGGEGSVRVWPLSYGALLELGCQRLAKFPSPLPTPCAQSND